MSFLSKMRNSRYDIWLWIPMASWTQSISSRFLESPLDLVCLHLIYVKLRSVFSVVPAWKKSTLVDACRVVSGCVLKSVSPLRGWNVVLWESLVSILSRVSCSIKTGYVFPVSHGGRRGPGNCQLCLSAKFRMGTLRSERRFAIIRLGKHFPCSQLLRTSWRGRHGPCL